MAYLKRNKIISIKLSVNGFSRRYNKINTKVMKFVEKISTDFDDDFGTD